MTTPTSVNELMSDLLQPEEVDRYADPDADPKAARKKAMDYLARREYGGEELTRKLANAGFGEAVARRAVDELRSDGLQDDRRFVENFIQSRVSQGKGPVRIQADLGQRGLPGGLVDEILEDSDVDWFSLATTVREKKFGQALAGEFKEKARQMRFLQQRGFEQAHIQAAVSDADDD